MIYAERICEHTYVSKIRNIMCIPELFAEVDNA